MYSVTMHVSAGKAIVVDKENHPFLESIRVTKNMNSPVGDFVFELAPLSVPSKTWMDVLEPGMLVEIRKRGRLRMLGLITEVSSSVEVDGPSARYSVKGSDFGIIFTKYAKLTTSAYLAGWMFDNKAVSEQFKVLTINNLKQELQPVLKNLAPLAWDGFMKIFDAQIGGSMTFSNDQTIEGICGVSGSKFFQISDQLKYKYPLYVNFLTTGATTLFDQLQSWTVPHFDEMWMDTTDGVTKYHLDNTKPSLKLGEGFRLFVRPSLYVPANFNKAIGRNIPPEKIRSVTAQKSSQEMSSIYLLTAEGIAGQLYSSGQAERDPRAMRKYGVNILECDIKSGYQGKEATQNLTDPNNVFATGSKALREMYENNDKMFSGTLSLVDTDVKIGEKFTATVPVGNGKRNLSGLIVGVTEEINYASPNPAPSLVATYVRGRYVR